MEPWPRGLFCREELGSQCRLQNQVHWPPHLLNIHVTIARGALREQVPGFTQRQSQRPDTNYALCLLAITSPELFSDLAAFAPFSHPSPSATAISPPKYYSLPSVCLFPTKQQRRTLQNTQTSLSRLNFSIAFCLSPRIKSKIPPKAF